MLIDVIAGARPNFVKIASITDAIEQAMQQGTSLSYRLIHTGQHYDRMMSDGFFEELNIREPHFNLGAGSGTQAEQTARIMLRYEEILLQTPCDLCLVVGDVTSTMACAITAKKLNIKVGHVEAGIRSGDMTMPEEVNRIVTDSICDYFFTTSQTANTNLLNAGAKHDAIYFVGNTMIDTLVKNEHRLKKPYFWSDEELQPGNYIVVTLHRPSNVDDPELLKQLVTTITEAAMGMKLIFPAHPRTAKALHDLKLQGLYITQPLGYLAFNYLVKNAKAVVTDSGGITEEATIMNIPCMTLRDTTERPETCTTGTNELLGTNAENIRAAFETLFSGNWKKGGIPEKWDGKAGERIINALLGMQVAVH